MTHFGQPSWLVLSQSLLWLVVVLQGVILVGLLRQVGLVSLRIGPKGARINDDGPALGEKVSLLELRTHSHSSNGKEFPSPSTIRNSMLVFVSPNCGACRRVMPGIRTLQAETKELVEWAVFCFGTSTESDRFRIDHKLEKVPFFWADSKIRAELRIHTVPFALLLDAEGVVQSKGVINHLEHLESLLEAMRQGIDQEGVMAAHEHQ